MSLYNSIIKLYDEMKDIDARKKKLLLGYKGEFALLYDFFRKFGKYRAIKYVRKVPVYKSFKRLNLNVIKDIVLNQDSFEFRDFDIFKKNFKKIFKKKMFEIDAEFNLEELEFIWRFIHDDVKLHQGNPYCVAYMKLKDEVGEEWREIIDRQIILLNAFQKVLNLYKVSLNNPDIEKHLEDLEHAKGGFEVERSFFRTLNFSFLEPTRREFGKASMDLIQGLVYGMIATTFALPILKMLFGEKGDEAYKIFLDHYKKHIQNDMIVKSFNGVYFIDPSKLTGKKVEFSISVDKLYKMVNYKSSFDRIHLDRMLSTPRKDLKKFIIALHDHNVQINMMHREGVGKAFFGFLYIDLCSILAFIQTYIAYVSDSKFETDKNGNMVKASGRNLYQPLYDKKEFRKYPEHTLIDGYGDCEDFALLAVALLRSIGWERVGLCHLSESKSVDYGHVILGIEVDEIDFVETFLIHQMSFSKEPMKYYPYIYCKKSLKLPKDYQKPYMAAPYEKNDDKFIILLEPQRYHVNAAAIDIEDYNKRIVVFEDEQIDLKKYRRIMRQENLNKDDFSEHSGFVCRIEEYVKQ